MKHGLTTVAKVVVYLLGIGVVAICAILLPELAREEAVGKVNPPSALPFLVAGWVLALPILVALYQTSQLFSAIEENTAFSPRSVRAMRMIKYCALAFGAMVISGVVTVAVIARAADPLEDITPVLTIGFLLVFASGAVATVVAVLQRILQEAIHLKAENDLTI